MYSFPSNPQLRDEWVQALINKNDQQNALRLPKWAVICAEHFDKNCLIKVGLSSVRLKPNTIPMIFPRANNGRQEMMSVYNSPGASHQELSEPRYQESSEMPALTENNSIILPSLETPSTSRKKIRYPGDVSEEMLDEMSPKRLKACLRVCMEACKKKDSKIKCLQSEKARLEKKIDSLQQLLSELREKNLISSSTSDVIESISEESSIIREIEKGKVNGQYSPQLRAFALTLNLYSPKAYNYVREVYRNKLPAPSTLCSWYSSTNGSPGFTQEAVDILKKKCEAAGDKKLYATLIMDEMAIRRQVEWNHQEKKFVGYIDCGAVIPEPDDMSLAKEALVYMLTGINERWKIPVAYFFINGLTAEERADITIKVLEFVASSGVNVIALTFDGLPGNIKMCTELQADVYNEKPYFKHPTDNYNVAIFFDAAHMLKLIRTAWASKRVLYDSDDNPINWTYIEKLVALQENGCFHLTNRINNKHLQWQTNKMNVKLAAQTLSESCAAALETLMLEKHPDFVHCEPTVKFLRFVNNTFDCLNSRCLFSYGFKQPLKTQNAIEIFEFLNNATAYFSTIKINPAGSYIIHSKSKTGFLGFLINIRNLKQIYHEYVETGYLKYILSYKFSQDHLEIFFSCIRAMGGYNNNPNCIQFTAVYKRLLLHNEVKSSAAANCLPLDKTTLLTISSAKIRKPEQMIEDDDQLQVDNIPIEYINPTAHHAVLYIAGFIEMRVLQTLRCNRCVQLLHECAEATSVFIKIKTMGNLRYPRRDTYTIVTVVEKIFNMYRVENKLNTKNIFYKITNNCIRHFNIDKIFKNFDSHIKDNDILNNHKYELIKMIIELYLKVRLYYFGKLLTRHVQSEYVRKRFTKLVLFKGQ